MKKSFPIAVVLAISLLEGMTHASTAQAVTLGTQDLFIFDNPRVTSGGTEVNLTSNLISTALNSPGDSVTFHGGATFTSTTAFESFALDKDLFRLENITVTPGVLSYGGNQFFSALTSADLDIAPRNIGISDLVQFDLNSVFPTNVRIGDIGRFNSTFIQLLPPSNPASEAGLSSLQVAASRANQGLVQIPSLDNATPAQVFNQPFVVAEGSDGWRYFGKGLTVVGTTIKGALNGASTGSVVPAIGTTVGGIVGGFFGFFTSLIEAIDKNKAPTQPSQVIEWETEVAALIPSAGPPQAVPEPLTIFGTGTALGFGVLLKKRELSKKQKIEAMKA